MAYYPDLSPYKYYLRALDPNTVNIGWLAPEHPVPTGRSSTIFLDHLWKYCGKSVLQSKGIHTCELCEEPMFFHVAERKGKTLRLGTAEIRVKGKNGVIYAAPDLIYHYVVDHQYRPPQEFIEAVEREPQYLVVEVKYSR